MYANQLMYAIITIFFIAIFTGDVVCKRSEHVTCNTVTVVEETDPKDRNLIPAFFERKKCQGGKKLSSGYQCQAVKTKSITVTVHRRVLYKGEARADIPLTKQSAESCKEVCVCGSLCSNPQKAICAENYRWDASACKCIYDCGGKFSAHASHTKSIPRQYFYIGIGALFIFFIIVSIALVFYCKAKIKRKQTKYRYLRKVVWNKAQDEKLKNYLSAVDGRPGDRKSTSWLCCACPPSGDNQHRADGRDEEDSPLGLEEMDTENFSAKDCWEIGHAFYCQNKFHEMLEWIKRAEIRHREQSLNVQRSLNTHLAFAYLANGKTEDATTLLLQARDERQRNGAAPTEQSNTED